MAGKLSTSLSGRTQSAWPLVLLLLVAVAVPAACVLWFMTEAMRNEQLAVRGRLTAVYQGQLDTLGRRVDDFWEQKQATLTAVDHDGKTPAEVFAELVRSGLADSVIVYDVAGEVTYPTDAALEYADRPSGEGHWFEAWRLEYQSNNYMESAGAYLAIANDASEAGQRDAAAQALWAQARCLVKAGQGLAALEILIGELHESYGDATDTQGNLLLPAAQLWALEKIAKPESDEFRETLQTLFNRLEDYGAPVMTASQRLFLMRQLIEVSPLPVEFSTLEAEILAADYLDDLQSQLQPADQRHLRRSGFDDVWELASLGKAAPVVALFSEERILKEMQALVETELAVPHATVRLVPPGAEPSEAVANLTGSAGQFLPDWQLALQFDDPDPFAAAADSRITMYLYSGIVVVLAMVALAGLVARYMSGQIRVTRLRNDLIATVSHELKTPLASIRALIDTLLEGRYHDKAQHREYLQLAAKENERLSRLIDNFLAFSRMERNKRTFEFCEVSVDEIVSAATDAVREEFQASGAQLEVELGDDLPDVIGDADALTTVLVDLLDNAHKYTGDEKHVILRASAREGKVCLEVEDNGVGLSRREAKKVFERFYQVDETLSRRAGGCGLGLSIVQFIVTNHGGSVGVSSQPGKGSTFIVTLPAAKMKLVEDH